MVADRSRRQRAGAAGRPMLRTGRPWKVRVQGVESAHTRWVPLFLHARLRSKFVAANWPLSHPIQGVQGWPPPGVRAQVDFRTLRRTSRGAEAQSTSDTPLLQAPEPGPRSRWPPPPDAAWPIDQSCKHGRRLMCLGYSCSRSLEHQPRAAVLRAASAIRPSLTPGTGFPGACPWFPSVTATEIAVIHR